MWRAVTALILLCIASFSYAEISSGRIKGDDEPHIVSWRVLEGITEPFESNQQEFIPPWKQMKNAADQKAAGMAIQQALHEYGQLLRHPYMFGDMPMEERYDVFLSMSKLLKTMGFHQRAELLLYEAMSYTTNPHEAHLQLGLLFLDKEDLEKAKIHLKNCLFFKENDVLILIHLAVILIAEGKIHEAKFFLSRILSGLEARLHTLSFAFAERDIKALTTAAVDYKVLSTWVEDLIVKVFYGEFRFTPSSTMDMLKLFSNLYRWISEGELVGRFIFDLGQSLYEGGRPKIGQMMMKRGFETSDALVEGAVSTAIVDMRLALDFPVVPESVVEVLESYLNMTNFLSNSSANYTPIDLENVVDLYWPLPLLAWSALPVMPVMKELLWRFQGGPERTDLQSLYWLKETTYDEIIDLYQPAKEVVSADRFDRQERKPKATKVSKATEVPDLEKSVFSFDALKSKDQQVRGGIRTVVIPPTSSSQRGGKGSAPAPPIKVEVGIFGGHMNNHPVGQMVFRRLLGLNAAPKGADSSGTDWRDLISLTLLALPLVPDTTTKRIAGGVTRIVNLPMDTAQAWRIIQDLHLDVVVFPDWQPFPDQQSVLFQSRRVAPVQVCMFVRGGSCASVAVDYYLMPMELEEAYLQGTPAAAIDAVALVKTAVSGSPASTSKSAPATGTAARQTVPQEGSFVPPPIPSAGDVSSDPSLVRTGPRQVRLVEKPLRPQWREFFAEQVVLLDWPLLTPAVVQGIAQTVAADEATSASRNTQSSSGSRESASAYGRASDGRSGGSSLDDASHAMLFSPMEIEGKIFFENQPVAVLPVYPSCVSPLMDELLFKIMRSVPSLHVVLALPEGFFTHARDTKHRISWARKLVRRLWARGGSMFHRIRLLPSPLGDQRLMQLLRQADMVLDTFPVGSSFYHLSLALSVGTPVITLRPGTAMHSSKEELREVRNYLAATRQKQRQNNVTMVNPMAHYVAQNDLPFAPSISSVAGFYKSIKMDEFFVANSTAEYFQLASALATNREFAYSLRVRLLEAVDGQRRQQRSGVSSKRAAAEDPAAATGKAGGSAGKSAGSAAPEATGATMEDWEEENTQENNNSPVESDAAESVAVGQDEAGAVVDCGHCVDDLGRFFLSVGVPFARSRTWRLQALQQRTGTARVSAQTGAGDKRGRSRPRSSSDAEGIDDFHGSGVIS